MGDATAEKEQRQYKDWTHAPITWDDLRHAFGTFLATSGFASATIEEW
jgi:hypothetical protein